MHFQYVYSDVFAFRGCTSCEAEDCPRVSKPKMGHGFCAAHCACLLQKDDMYVYDPYRCDTCIDFVKGHCQGVDDASCIKGAMAEMDAHIKKLRRYLESLDGKPRLKTSSFVAELKSRGRKLDFDYFKALLVREGYDSDDERELVVSIPISVASGSSRRGTVNSHFTRVIISETARVKQFRVK